MMDARAFAGRRFLVVDDNQPNRDLMKIVLMTAGATVDEAVDGQEAIDACGQTHYDAVLMDVQMPRIDGMEATRIIRAAESSSTSRTIIVAVTAHAMAEHCQRFLDAGMDAVITKPIEPMSVIDEIASLLSAGLREDDTHA